MQSLQDLEDKLFFECKNIIERISKINTKEELLVKQDFLSTLSDKVVVLKYLENNPSLFEEDRDVVVSGFPNLNYDEKNDVVEKKEDEETALEEEVLFTNELNEDIFDIDDEEAASNVNSTIEGSIAENNVTEQEEKESIKDNNQSNELPEQEPSIVVHEKITKVTEKLERQYNEQVVAQIKDNQSVSYKKEMTNEEKVVHDKKMKLAHIKGLKSLPSLFDEETMQETVDERHYNSSSEIQANNAAKENAKALSDFRLDLNDKLAFSKMLFKGSQVELNHAINHLNSLETLEEAKEYLSDLYYEKNWKKVDEYAQRLWTLVENKFI